MNRAPEYTLQQAVYDKLKLNAALMAKLEATGGGIYDNVPDKTGYPRVVIGEGTLADWDTESSFGAEQTITVHIWSDSPGQKETKELIGLVYQALHEVDLDLDGFTSTLIRREFSTNMLDADGATRHGVLRFRSIIEEAS